MKLFEQCPVCGGELESREVTEILSGGGNTASLKVPAEVCLRCGEHLYSAEVALCFDEICEKLKKNEFTHFKPLGQSFTVEEGWPSKTVHSCG
jgi:YgiT-type zinc finger domain-containing protein